jgi:hypothetical protein
MQMGRDIRNRQREFDKWKGDWFDHCTNISEKRSNEIAL